MSAIHFASDFDPTWIFDVRRGGLLSPLNRKSQIKEMNV
jgi:hypothetical protein